MKFIIRVAVVKLHSCIRKIIRKLIPKTITPVVRIDQISEFTHLSRIENYKKYKVKNRIAYYTAVTGGYEVPKVPEFLDFDVDYFLFTDDESLQVREPYQKVLLDKYESDPTRLARWVKTNPHLILPDYDYAIWVDSNILSRNSLMPYVDLLRKTGSDIGMFKHPQRNNFQEEVEACISLAKDSTRDIQFQFEAYKENYGIEKLNQVELIETNVFVVNLKSDSAKSFLEGWYKEIFKYSRRDQLALPAAVCNTPNLKILHLEQDSSEIPRFNKKNFEIYKHGVNNYIEPTYLPSVNTLSTYTAYNDAAEDSTLTIVVPVYNAPEEVEELLQSISNQTDKDFELVLVDDCSEQRTKDIIASYEFANSNVIVHEVNKGYTITVNDGVEAANGNLIAVLNSDTVLPSTFVEEVKAYALQYPDYSAFGPITNAGSWQNVPNLRDKDGNIAVNELPLGVDIDQFNERIKEIGLAGKLVNVNLLNGFCYIVRREVYDKVGMLDHIRFPKGYGEEDDFFIRANIEGFKVGIMTGLYVYHHKTKSFTSEQKKMFSKSGLEELHRTYSKGLVVRLVKNSSENPDLHNLRSIFLREFY